MSASLPYTASNATLGLSTVYGIASQVGGTIEVFTTLEQGSRFDVYLPVTAPVAGASTGTGGALVDAAGTETILVVDDEQPVARFAQRMLTAAGYTVLTAHHAGEALIVSEKYTAPIQLVLTDVIMPQMSGRELADRLVQRRPELRVLYMSGYTDDILTDNHALGAERQLLRKPFTGELLLRKVRDVLDQPWPTDSISARRSTE